MFSWQTTTQLLVWVGQGTSVILFGILWSRKTKLGMPFRPLLWYLLFDSFSYVLGFFAKKFLHNNIFNFHFSTFSDVAWLTIIFIFLASDKAKPVIKLGWILFFFSAIISASWLDGLFTNINTFSRITGNSFLVFMAIRQLNQMMLYSKLLPPERSPVFIFCITVIIYYSTSLLMFLGQDLPRYDWFNELHIELNPKDFNLITLTFYPLLRAIQFGLLLHLITLFPMGITPRHALPRWLRFRLGWRPPTKNWRYRVLPPHLVG